MSQRKFKVVSLFSGAMGLDLGLEKTGKFEIVACVEVEKAYCDTIRLNQKQGRLPAHLKVLERDISQLSVDEFLATTGLRAEDIDVIVGGPPCQSFSTAGKRQSVADPRGTLLWDFLRFVKEIQPKFFVMENVRGLISAAIKHRPIAERPEKGGPPLEEQEMPGSVVANFARDLQSFEGHSYHMDCFEVNAVNYGAPQLRERAIFIGNRLGQTVDFPNPTHGPIGEVKRDLFETNEPLLPWRTLREALAGIEDLGPVLDFSPRKKQFLSMVPEGSNWRSLPEEVQKESMGRAWFAKGGRSGWWRRLTFDLPCPTLVTMPNHASTALCHPSETRALSLREYARIQEFPDDWEFCGSVAQQYAQIGNAVPVRLGEVAGEVIAAGLRRPRSKNSPTSKEVLTPFRTVYLQAHVRTRQWFKKGETFVWEEGGANDGAQYAAPKTVRKTSKMKMASNA